MSGAAVASSKQPEPKPEEPKLVQVQHWYAPPPVIHIHVDAWDAKSFMAHRNEIAEAIAQALDEGTVPGLRRIIREA